MKIVNLDAYTIHLNDLDWNELAQLGDLVTYDRIAPEDVIPAIENADAVFTSKVKLTKEVIEACPNLKFIGVTATGYDNIDLDAAKARGIAVCNVPAYSTESVAQHTFALILEITNHVGHYTELVHEHQWEKSLDFTFIDRPLTQLSGRSLGIIGYGSIGKRVARIAEAFGMTVHVYSKDPDAAVQSDILTLHCPATADNRGFINKDFISKMKDGVMIINTGRGQLIHTNALIEGLKNKKIGSAGLDVYEEESEYFYEDQSDRIIDDDVLARLLSFNNVIVTSHQAFFTREAMGNIAVTTLQNIKDFINHKPLLNEVKR